VTADTDTVEELTTIAATFTCTSAGTFTFALTHGTTTANATLTCAAATATTAPSATPTATLTPVPVPSCGSGTSLVIPCIPENTIVRTAIGGSTPDCGGVGIAGIIPGFGNNLTLLFGAFGDPQGTPCVSNRSNVEIVPAPGSDNDARIDIRVRNAADTSIQNAHVHFIVTNGSITVGDGTTPFANPGLVHDDSVAEPLTSIFGVSDALGVTSLGDDCDRNVNQGTGIDNNSDPAPNPILPQEADGFTNSNGIISACYFASFPGAPTATPGPATVTILIDIPTVTALVTSVTITVIGPPASLTITASPTSLRCGEKSTITVTVKDSIGQNVSDHTPVNLVTNFGGVLAGGSPFFGSSFVSPLSSGAGETFAGVATAFLLTSETHSGPYEVVATAGGSFTGGIFSTPGISGQVTVTCGAPPAPTAAATVRAPSTGEGASVVPPNTGDGGLAGGSGSNPLVLALSGIATLALAGFATLKVARR
jgi:hypothetical protein